MKSTEPFLVVDSNNFAVLDLVDHNNIYHKEIAIKEALEKANEIGLDLVCFSNNVKDNNALCKLIDYGRWKYQKEKKNKKIKKDQKSETKEIRFSPSISDHDIDHKIKHAKEFIENGHDLSFTMKLRKRVNRDVAKTKMNQILLKCENFATIVSIKNEYNFISVKLTKNKEYEK